MAQTKEQKEAILRNLPAGTIRLQVISPDGKQGYKRPEEIDTDFDEIPLSTEGFPIVMKGKPGRPLKSSLPPVTPMVAQVSQVRDDHMESSQVTREVEKNPDGEDTFNLILKGMADEAASIEFDRMEAQRNGLDASDHATKRARILKAIAELIMSRKKISDGGTVDMDSPAFQALFKQLLQTFRAAMEESGLHPEHVETIFSKLVSKLGEPSWKEDAKNKMRGKS